MTTRNSLQPTSIDVNLKPCPTTSACSFSAAASVVGLPNTTSGPVVYAGSPSSHACPLFGDADDVPEKATRATAPAAMASNWTTLTASTPTMPARDLGRSLRDPQNRITGEVVPSGNSLIR